MEGRGPAHCPEDDGCQDEQHGRGERESAACCGEPGVLDGEPSAEQQDGACGCRYRGTRGGACYMTAQVTGAGQDNVAAERLPDQASRCDQVRRAESCNCQAR